MEKIRIAVRKFDPFESTLQKLWDAFSLQNNIKIEAEMVALELHDLYETTISEKGLKEGKWDIAHINTDWIFDAANENAVLNLFSLIGENPPENYPFGWHKSLLHLQKLSNGIFGLPFHDGPECLIYRKDLFENETEKENFKKQFGYELSTPKTWQEFSEIATFFNRPEQNLYGAVFANYPDGHNMVFDFCLQLWTRGGSLLNKKNQIDIHNEAAIKALDFYRKMVNDKNAVHPKSREFGSVEAGLAFAEGQAAIAINWFGFASMAEVIEESKVKGKIDITSLPSDPGHKTASLNVYWLYTIGSGSKHKKLAYDFLRFATTPESDKLLTTEGGIGCRKSTWKDEEINTLIPFYHKLEMLHENALTLPQTPIWPKVAELIDGAVLKAIETNISSAIILEETQKKIKELSQGTTLHSSVKN
ncbi:multiple sugar transport system substrate-binding protein [Flavobacterium nitrogenifigens]|uniref:Multiple sugar transport system substrate-binding protein n=2 Tax=Flavobacterium TaxID=237 RepID=A0A7W7IX84_9FLAO|nr:MULTISPECIES: extracellular solute-binding protein [Flavobacterium]MBB4802251.1 multiple sugar transport system substrate-binding protein [Flavobacterium nitrogenifigens]MBB6387209.1 multiple sugar transport system substrate-binding protein [Flavobacterium notoginsengisoli]